VTDLADPASEQVPLPAPSRRRLPAASAVRAWRQLTSMRVALILLFLLALVAIPGSLFPQRGTDAASVTTYYQQHPGIAPLLDRLGMFDVYASPWFAAVYLLLFVSLVGCVVPRLSQHLATVRQPPPPAPRNLSRLAQHATYDGAGDGEIERVAAVLRRKRWRTTIRDGAVCAEKGFVREWGNLLFHYALVLLLIGIACGGLFGWKGSVILVQGQTFANTPFQYNSFQHGRLVDVRTIQPFGVHLDNFSAAYLPSAEPSDFFATVTWQPDGSAAPAHAQISPNHPLGVPSTFLDGPTNVYLIGHGYALHVIVKDPNGRVVYDDTEPARPMPGDNFLTSTGAVKVADAKPEQLGFQALFAPTYAAGGASSFPAPDDPRLTLTAYHGNLGPGGQTVYDLDTSTMTPFMDGMVSAQKSLGVGESWTLPDGYTATFAGFTNWVQLSVNHDPGKRTALAGAVLMVIGLLLSLFVSRRRIWARLVPADGAASVVEVGGLSRREGDSFDDEFAGLVRQLSGAEGKETPA
jgi:cytochrome c biogenesis protein